MLKGIPNRMIYVAASTFKNKYKNWNNASCGPFPTKPHFFQWVKRYVGNDCLNTGVVQKGQKIGRKSSLTNFLPIKKIDFFLLLLFFCFLVFVFLFFLSCFWKDLILKSSNYPLLKWPIPIVNDYTFNCSFNSKFYNRMSVLRKLLAESRSKRNIWKFCFYFCLYYGLTTTLFYDFHFNFLKILQKVLPLGFNKACYSYYLLYFKTKWLPIPHF